jgi:hypothetical protein
MVQAEKPAESVGAPSSAYRLGHPFGKLIADPTKLILTLGVFPRSLLPRVLCMLMLMKVRIHTRLYAYH